MCKLRRYLLLAGLSVLTGIGVTCTLLSDDAEPMLHRVALFRPGESTSYAAAVHTLPFQSVLPPIAVGTKFFLLGAKHGVCSGVAARSDPFILYSIDSGTGEFTELLSKGAPLARRDARILPVADGFLLLGGYRNLADSSCDRSSQLLFRLVSAAYEWLPLERIYSSDDAFAQLFRHERRITPLPFDQALMREAYHYSTVTNSWERVPSLDLVSVETEEDLNALQELDRLGSGTTVLAPTLDVGKQAGYLDREGRRWVPVPSLDSLVDSGLQAENDWLRPTEVDGKVVLYFPEGTLSARSAEAINEQRNAEAQALAELREGEEDRWSEKLDALSLRTTSHAGLVFDLATERWAPMSSSGAPPRIPHGLFMGVGTKVNDRYLVLTGDPDRPGAVYDPRADRWKGISSVGAPAVGLIQALAFQDKVIVYPAPGELYGPQSKDRTLYLYDLKANRWSSILSPTLRPISTVLDAGSQLLLVDETSDILEWVDPNTGRRTVFNAPPELSGFGFASSKDAVLLYTVAELGS